MWSGIFMWSPLLHQPFPVLALWDHTILMSLEDESQKCRGYFPTLSFTSHQSEQAFLLLPSTLRIKGLGEVRNVGA